MGVSAPNKHGYHVPTLQRSSSTMVGVKKIWHEYENVKRLLSLLQDSKKHTVRTANRTQTGCEIGEPHSDNPVGAMAPANTVQALQKADKAVQQDPVPTSTRPNTCSFSVNVPMPLPVCHSPSSSSWKQQKTSPPELQRVNQAVEAEHVMWTIITPLQFHFRTMNKQI